MEFVAESGLARTRRARRINRELAVRYPQAGCELIYRTPFELLVATVLSAQTTDARVNAVTGDLFACCPDPQTLAAADPQTIEDLIYSTGFYRAKTRSIQGLAQVLVQRFGGEVPGRMQDLVELPGVGRKTANVVLGNAFGVPGLAVDTHVSRLAKRFRLTTSSDPVQIEKDLCALWERREWTLVGHRLIFHGRRTCFARSPACGACPVARWCPSAGIGESDPERAAALLKG